MSIVSFLIILVAPLILAACGEAAPAVNQATAVPAQVITTFYPTRYFAQRISGGVVRVECPTPADADPIFWVPDEAVTQRFQTAELVVLNGAGFERWAATAALPLQRTCESARVFKDEFLTYAGVSHSHGASGEHTHAGTDGHTWMDPLNALRQAEAIAGRMAAQWPMHERDFRQGFDGLAADLKQLDERLRGLSERLAGVSLIASHPAYNYPARRYGWTLHNIDLPPDEAPSQAQREALRAAIAKGDSRMAIVLFESDPSAEVRAALGAAAVVTFEPAEMLDPAREARGEDYLSIMNANVDRLESAMKPADRSIP